MRTDTPHETADRPPPVPMGPNRVTIAIPHCDRRASLADAAEAPGKDTKVGAAGISGPAKWRFCAECQAPLGCDRHGNQREKFCSVSCRRSYHAAHALSAAERHRQWLARQRAVCVVCQAVFSATRGRRITCSDACLHTWRKRCRSPEFDAKLRAFWAQGLSQAEIAARLHVTKNVIVGLRRRLGLAPHPSQKVTAKPPKARAPRPQRPSGPGRWCSAHPEITWHAEGTRCRAAAC